MQVVIVGTPRENEDDQSVRFDLIDDALVAYPFSADIPLGVNIQAHLGAHGSEYLRLIRVCEYPEAPAQHRQSLSDIEAWIAKGAWISAIKGEDGKVIKPRRKAKKIPWTNKHPEPTSEDRLSLLEARLDILESAMKEKA